MQRLRRISDDHAQPLPLHSSPPPPLSTARPSTPLIDALRPVLPIFHPFLDDTDAAHLLCTSRPTALTLLSGYTFTSHMFEPASLASLHRLRDLCASHKLHITQLALPSPFLDLAFDAAPPHLSPIPASVTVLLFGSPTTYRGEASAAQQQQRWAVFTAAIDEWTDTVPWQPSPPHPTPLSYEEEARGWLLRDDRSGVAHCPPMPWFPHYGYQLDCPLSPGLLPSGLRVLQLNNRPLQPGCLPPSLTSLHLSTRFDQPVAPDVLPASLLYLCVQGNMRQHHALLQESLPTSLLRLRLQDWPHPLQAGLWPPRLQALDLSGLQQPLQPRVLPSSLLFVSFGAHSHPLFPNALPPSLVELLLCISYPWPFAPGVLPSSLRRLQLSFHLTAQLQVGALPEGLLLIGFLAYGHAFAIPPLYPGTLPSTLLGVDLSERYAHPLPAGVIPPSVRWIRLSSRYRDQHIEAVLPPEAVVWWH